MHVGRFIAPILIDKGVALENGQSEINVAFQRAV